MLFLKRLDQYLGRLEKFIISVSMMVLTFILVGGVISRFFFKYSWAFTEEMGQFLVIAITFIGLSYAARQQRHISMSAVYDLVPTALKKIFFVIVTLGTALTLFYLAYLGIEYTLNMKKFGRVSPALNIPVYLIFILIPIGFILGGIQYLKLFFQEMFKAKLKNG